MKKTFFLFLTFFWTSIIFAQQEATTTDGKKVILYENGLWIYSETEVISGLEIPKTKPSDEVVKHNAYSFTYNEKYEQANWIAYQLTREKAVSTFPRTNKFIPDPLVKTETANNKDYEKSGYDRGHLAPAADMGWSAITMSESFYFSNMSPQVPEFNRGIWKELESLVRNWAVEKESIYIVTGPVLTDDLPTIGENKVSVPKYYYKVILDYTEPGLKGIGFILPNAGSNDSLHYFAVTIDSVEKLTGIDFFPLLPDQQEKIIESSLTIKEWPWSSKTKAVEKKVAVLTCKGTTRTGENCKAQNINANGYCDSHKVQLEEKKVAPNQCQGITKAGERCKKNQNKDGYCNLHEDQMNKDNR